MKRVTFLLVALFLCGCTNEIVSQEIQQTQQTPIQQMTVYYEGEKREKEIFEPEQGKILLGAFIKQDKNIESMEYFEKLTEKSHEIYGFTTTLTEEFPITKNEYEQIENRSVLLQCIKELGEPDSHIFIMKYYLGHSTKMIAEKFDLKQNTVDKKVQRGLEKLKKALQGGVFYE